MNGHGLDGVAVVSEIIASPNPKAAARRLLDIYRAWASMPHSPACFGSTPSFTSKETLVRLVGDLLYEVRHIKPLVHQVCA